MAAYVFPRRYRPGRYLGRRGGSGHALPVVIAVAVLAAGASAKTVTTGHRHSPAPASPRLAAPGPGEAGAGNVALGASLAGTYGWGGGSQWACLYNLWERESGWQNDIANPQSGAFGIAQALGHGSSGAAAVVAVVRYPDGSASSGVTVNEYPSQAANSGDARAQVKWGLSYIQGTYGTPCGAWGHEEADSWY